MVLVSGTFTVLARLVGAVAGDTLGWAIILLFGRVPQSRHRLLSLMAFGSIAWLVAVAALLLPPANQLLVSAVPRAGVIQLQWIGWVILAAALFLPAVVGGATTLLSPEDGSRDPLGRLVQVARGYPFTAVLAATIVFLAAWAIIRGARSLQRGWLSVHIPMIVKPGCYDAVVNDVESALGAAGLQLERHPASRWFVLPPQLLARAGGLDVGRLVPERLIAFNGRDLAILVYPSDVAIVGEATLVARARSAVARRLPFSDAYLTTAKESEQIEDRLRELAQRPFVQATDFQPIDALLASLVVPHDEWETLLRLRMQIEHELLATPRRPAAGSA